jgi:hypothetical protein
MFSWLPLSFFLLLTIFNQGCQLFPNVPALQTNSDPGSLSGDDNGPDQPGDEDKPSFDAPRVENLTGTDLSANLTALLAGGIDPRAASGRVARIRVDILRSEINNSRILRLRRHGPFQETAEFSNSIEDLPKFNCDEPLASLAVEGQVPVQVIDDFEIADTELRFQLPNSRNLDGDTNLNGSVDTNENPLVADRFYVYTFCFGNREAGTGNLNWEYKNLSVLYTLDTFPSAIKQNPLAPDSSEQFIVAPSITAGSCTDGEEKKSNFTFGFHHRLRDSTIGPFVGLAAAGSSEVGVELRYFTTDEGDTSVLFNTQNEGGPFGALNTNGVGSVVRVNIPKTKADQILGLLRNGEAIDFNFATRSVQSNPNNTGEINFAGQPIESETFRIGVEFIIKDRAHDATAIMRDFPAPQNVLFSSPFGAINTFGRIPPPFLPSGRAIRAYLSGVAKCPDPPATP